MTSTFDCQPLAINSYNAPRLAHQFGGKERNVAQARSHIERAHARSKAGGAKEIPGPRTKNCCLEKKPFLFGLAVSHQVIALNTCLR
jgi:hypothetical protein